MEPLPPVDMTHPIVRHVWPLAKAPYDARLQAALVAFNEAHDDSLSFPLSPTDARRVAVWLRKEEMSTPTNANGHTYDLLNGRRDVLFPFVHSELSSKITWLQQAPCITCVADDKAEPGRMSFPIQAAPFSAQSVTPERLKRIKAAITADLAGRTYSGFKEPAFSRGRFCVNVVSIVPAKVHIKDVDNMIKGLLDAMSGVVYRDDKQIQHVSSHRVEHDGPKAFYLVSVLPVLDISSDVIDHELRISFAGAPPIDID